MQPHRPSFILTYISPYLRQTELYTCDVSFDNLQKKVLGSDKFEYSDMTRIMKKRKKVIERIKRDRRRKEIEEGKQRITDLFLKDKEIVAMREIFTEVRLPPFDSFGGKRPDFRRPFHFLFFL